VKNNDTKLETLFGLHTVQMLIEDLEILEQTFACLKLEEHMFGCSCTYVWFLVWFQLC